MTIETATYISQLDATYPAAGDAKSEGDNHLRLIKSAVKATFPNLTAAAVTPTTTELNYVDGVTSAIQTQLDAKAPSTFLQAGTGATSRTVQAKLRDSISVKDFGATGDGTTDDTTAIQAAIDYAQTFDPGLDLAEGSRAKVHFPAGVYLTGTLNITKKLALTGDGWMNTTLVLKSGVTTSLIVITAENVGGTTVDDVSATLIEDMFLNGNRPDLTPGSSHAIECPDAAWSIATQYSPSFVGRGLRIENFTGSGIFLGVNRNAMNLFQSWVRYCNTSGISSYSYDHLITQCAIGVCVDYGIRIFAGGAVAISDSTIFYCVIGVVVNNSADNTLHLTNCAIDHHTQYGVYLSGAAGDQGHSIVNCRFQGNSSSATNTYSDIYIASTADNVAVIGCQFLYEAAQQVKYLVETNAACNVQWCGNLYAVSGSIPYGTAVTNSTDRLNPRTSYLSGLVDISASTGGQIKFPASQNASSDANTLDDYEEGTFSPTVLSTGGGSATYVRQVGRYTKVGRKVTCNFLVEISAHTGSGTMAVGAMPFTSENVTDAFACASIGFFSSLTLPASNAISGLMPANANYVSLYSLPTGGTATAALALDTAFVIVGSITYFV